MGEAPEDEVIIEEVPKEAHAEAKSIETEQEFIGADPSGCCAELLTDDGAVEEEVAGSDNQISMKILAAFAEDNRSPADKALDLLEDVMPSACSRLHSGRTYAPSSASFRFEDFQFPPTPLSYYANCWAALVCNSLKGRQAQKHILPPRFPSLLLLSSGFTHVICKQCKVQLLKSNCPKPAQCRGEERHDSFGAAGAISSLEGA
eukprot:Skav211070  [mRNA]  locus=scaffold314:252409:253878:- [translate_table: standard]